MREGLEMKSFLQQFSERFSLALLVMGMCIVLVIASFFIDSFRAQVLTIIGSWISALIGFYFGQQRRPGT